MQKLNKNPSSIDIEIEMVDVTDIPVSLPFTHATTVASFDLITKSEGLVPRSCSAFDQEIIFLFYGGVFYRTSNEVTRDQNKLPIAFLFRPPVCEKVTCYFPFDTGAAYKKNMFKGFEDQLQRKELFRINHRHLTTPAKIVKRLFDTNEAYLSAVPKKKAVNDSDILATLFDLLNSDFTGNGVDRRQVAIEAHLKSNLKFLNNLRWIGFPETYASQYAKLHQVLKSDPPIHYHYPVDSSYTPDQILAQLSAKAREQIHQTLLSGGRRL